MVDLNTQMEIDKLVDYAYDKTIERLNAIEGAPDNSIYRTLGAIKGNYKSFLLAYLNYYIGCLEGILFTRFLEKFDRMPSPSENSFIKESIEQKFEDLKEAVASIADKKFKQYENE